MRATCNNNSTTCTPVRFGTAWFLDRADGAALNGDNGRTVRRLKVNPCIALKAARWMNIDLTGLGSDDFARERTRNREHNLGIRGPATAGPGPPLARAWRATGVQCRVTISLDEHDRIGRGKCVPVL